jgi:hypothetical protein
MSDAAPYRSSERDEAEAAVDAYYELLGEVRALRGRVIVFGGVATSAAGYAGVIAHIRGHWSIVGAEPNGTYYVGVWTMAVAFALLAAPAAAITTIIYRWLLHGLTRAWVERSVAKYGLARETLERRARGRM